MTLTIAPKTSSTFIPYRPFELGESNIAKMAIYNYIQYLSAEKSDEYPYLRECFANLYDLEVQDPEKKIIAAEASGALARATLDRYNDIYKRMFIANAANSALVCAELDNQYWNEICSFLVDKIEEQGMDFSQANAAGIVMMREEDLNKAGVVFTPDSI